MCLLFAIPIHYFKTTNLKINYLTVFYELNEVAYFNRFVVGDKTNQYKTIIGCHGGVGYVERCQGPDLLKQLYIQDLHASSYFLYLIDPGIFVISGLKKAAKNLTCY